MTRARILADYVSGGTTAAEFDYLDGVTSNIQTQMDAKSPTTGHASIATLGTVTSGTISTGTVIDDPTMTQGSDATGDVYYRAAGGALTRLATGADGTVLTSTGAAAVPAFEAIPDAGIVLQCLSKHHDGPLSSTSLASSDAFSTFTDLQISITPASGTKVLVLVQTNISGSSYNDGAPLLALFRDSTKIGMGGSTPGSRITVSVGVPNFSAAYSAAVADNVSIHFLDTHGADGSTAVIYKVGLAVRGSGSGTAYINRPPTDSDSAEHSRASSSITVMEIAQ